jgi:hypothetical protein
MFAKPDDQISTSMSSMSLANESTTSQQTPLSPRVDKQAVGFGVTSMELDEKIRSSISNLIPPLLDPLIESNRRLMTELSNRLESLAASKSTPPDPIHHNTLPSQAPQSINIEVTTTPPCLINTFNGSGDVLEFIANFKSGAIANNWSQAKQIEIIKVYLRGPAFELYEKLTPSEKSNIQLVFDKLTEKLVNKSTCSIQFKNVKPKPGESVKEFAYKLSDLLKRAMPSLKEEKREIKLKLKLIECVPEEKREALKLMESTMNWEQLVPVVSNVMPAFTDVALSIDVNAASTMVDRSERRYSSSSNMTNIKCHKCGGLGHFARDSPSSSNLNANRSRSFGPSRVNITV